MLSPQDLKNKTFNRAMRGYSPDEVDKYLEFLCDKYEELYRENRELEFKLKAATERAEAGPRSEDEVHQTLALAKKAADRVISDAETKAELLYSSARENTDRVLRAFREEIAGEAQALELLKKCVADLKESVYSQFRASLETVESLAPRSRYEEKLKQPGTAEYIRRVIEGMKNDISASGEEDEAPIEEDEDGRVKIKRTREHTTSASFRIISVKDTIRELNKQILADDADLDEPGTVIDGDEVAPAPKDVKKKVFRKKDKADIFDSDSE